MKKEEKLNELIEIFYEGLGYDIEVEQGDEFCAYCKDDIISYTLHDIAYNDLAFKNYLQKNYDLPPISTFTMSLLHELGHIITYPRLNKVKYFDAQLKKQVINRLTANSMKTAIAINTYYFGLYDEKKATDKAVELLLKNYEWCLKFEYFFKEELRARAQLMSALLLNYFYKLSSARMKRRPRFPGAPLKT